MRRLTTPKHIYNIPFDTALIDKVRIVYTQDEKIILCKELTECNCKDQTITVNLSQEETALFDCKKHYTEIQLHILTTGGESIVSNVVRVAVEKCLDTEVLE